MKKEGYNNFFNSQDGKVNIALLFSIALVFVMMLWSVRAMTITNVAPANLSFNGTRNINFTFVPRWDFANTGVPENLSNCSIYVNSTATGLWDVARNLSTIEITGADSHAAFIANNSLSWANYTFSGDGNYTFNIGCYNDNLTGAVL